MVYQDPARALNPTLRIGPQMTEVFEATEGLKGAAARERAAEMLARVQIQAPVASCTTTRTNCRAACSSE